jgi:adenosylhomocysteine nucleosidase
MMSAAACRVRALDRPLRPFAVILISANAEWKVVTARFPKVTMRQSPWGAFFEQHNVEVHGQARTIIFLHGGWGKVAAAGSAQWAIDQWHPSYMLNLGTCGGFAGAVEKHAILLVERTVIYDIVEAMGDASTAISDYTTDLDLSWLRASPPGIRRTLLVSADRDLVPAEIATLAQKYGAVAGDWESGAIAYTCAHNRQRVLILRGVTDLVTSQTGEAYGNESAFVAGTTVVMNRLLDDLPSWLERCP